MQSCMVGSFSSFHTLDVFHIVAIEIVQWHKWWLLMLKVSLLHLVYLIKIIMRSHSNIRINHSFGWVGHNGFCEFNEKKKISTVDFKSSSTMGLEWPNCHYNKQLKSFQRNIESINRRYDNKIEYISTVYFSEQSKTNITKSFQQQIFWSMSRTNQMSVRAFFPLPCEKRRCRITRQRNFSSVFFSSSFCSLTSPNHGFLYPCVWVS